MLRLGGRGQRGFSPARRFLDPGAGSADPDGLPRPPVHTTQQHTEPVTLESHHQDVLTGEEDEAVGDDITHDHYVQAYGQEGPILQHHNGEDGPGLTAHTVPTPARGLVQGPPGGRPHGARQRQHELNQTHRPHHEDPVHDAQVGQHVLVLKEDEKLDDVRPQPHVDEQHL